ncbi:unnamed protein product [Rodentolepis nana]|uniref:HAD family hydrolase n=1 Tax=Rodentolepis nana TaxID=102285 RepID=A0A0R3T8G3_RODNA|nr:unnamed protein product [Rodentolepis nana]
MVFRNLSRKPKLIVFDLGKYMLFRDGKVYDRFNHVVTPFPETGAVLQAIKGEPNIKIAVASSSAAPEMGRRFISLFGWDTYFDYVEIYPTGKTRHFRKLKRDSEISFQDMLFFDDLGFNIRDVSSLGVHCVHVDEDGVDLALLRSGLESFARANRTLWPFDCDDYYGSALYKKDGLIHDESGAQLTPFPHSEIILKRIKEEPGIKLAAASSTTSPNVGRKLLNLLGWDKYFDYVEIYPTPKTRHFKELENKSGISCDKMLFFDDLMFNIRDTKELGVHAVLVQGGVDLTVLRSALQSYASANS